MTVKDRTSRHLTEHSWVKEARGADIPEECKCRGAAANDKSRFSTQKFSTMVAHTLLCVDDFTILERVKSAMEETSDGPICNQNNSLCCSRAHKS